MAYIGNPVQQALTKVTSQSFNGTGSQTVFTLNRAVNTGEELEVFVENVQQEPGVGKSYTATGTTLTFDAAPQSGTGNIYVIYRGIAEVTRRLEHDPNAALAATTGTFSGAVSAASATVTGDLTVDTNTLYVDAANNRVGMGTASPQNLVQIEGSSGTVPSQLRLGVTASGQYYDIGRDYTDGLMTFYSGQASPYTGYKWSVNAGTEAMRIDSSGRVTMPYQPCFHAYRSAGGGNYSSTSPTVYVFNNAVVNVGGHYSTSTGRFTAGVAGNYHFSYQVLVRNVSSGARTHFYKNGSKYYSVGVGSSATYSSVSSEVTQGASAVIYLAAGDYVDVRVWTGGNGDIYGDTNLHNSFSGFLIG